MSVATETAKQRFVGDGVATAFAVTFGVIATSHVKVTLEIGGLETVLVNPTQYTLSAPNDDFSASFTVNTVATYGSTVSLTVERDIPLTQTTDLSIGDTEPQADRERVYDLLLMQMQEMREELSRTIKVPTSDAAAVNELVKDTLRAGLTLGFDGAGQPTVIGEEEPVAEPGRIEIGSGLYAGSRHGMLKISYTSLDVRSDVAKDLCIFVFGSVVAARAAVDAAVADGFIEKTYTDGAEKSRITWGLSGDFEFQATIRHRLEAIGFRPKDGSATEVDVAFVYRNESDPNDDRVELFVLTDQGSSIGGTGWIFWSIMLQGGDEAMRAPPPV